MSNVNCIAALLHGKRDVCIINTYLSLIFTILVMEQQIAEHYHQWNEHSYKWTLKSYIMSDV
jgi:hypothetical protein